MLKYTKEVAEMYIILLFLLEKFSFCRKAPIIPPFYYLPNQKQKDT